MVATMRVEVYLDGAEEPIHVSEPPARFQLDTLHLEDGHHTLKIVAIDRDGRTGFRIVPFEVRNGPAIAIEGLPKNGEVHGEVQILLNAFGSHDREWQVATAENPRRLQAWMWVIIIVVAAWAPYYGITMWSPSKKYADTPTYGEVPAKTSSSSSSASSSSSPSPSSSPSSFATQTSSPQSSSADSSSASSSSSSSAALLQLGASVYSSHCAACHQSDGKGMPGTFPPLAGDPVVTAKNARHQIETILFGKHGVAIDGVSYQARMPAWGRKLSNDEIAAVINHERTSWGNDAPTVTPSQVADVRKHGPPEKRDDTGGG